MIELKIKPEIDAEPIASWSNYRRDIYCCREKLYLTEKGEYLLHGEGHAKSKYARCVLRGKKRNIRICGWGAKWFRLEPEEALAWAQHRQIGIPKIRTLFFDTLGG